MHQNYDILERFNKWLWGYSPALVKPSLMMSTTDWHSEARHRLVWLGCYIVIKRCFSLQKFKMRDLKNPANSLEMKMREN